MITSEVIQEHFLKVPVVRRENFEILLEEHVSGTFAHCNVKKYNLTVKRELQECWGLLTKLHGGPIYALHDLPDHKHRKFLCLFGFRRLKALPCLKELWIWRPVYG